MARAQAYNGWFVVFPVTSKLQNSTKLDMWNFMFIFLWCIGRLLYSQSTPCSCFIMVDPLLQPTYNRCHFHTPMSEIYDIMTSSNGNIFLRYWPPMNSPHKGQWRGALMFSLICAWIDDWVNNREAGDLTRHRSHCDVNVLKIILVGWFSDRFCSSAVVVCI